MKQNHNFNSFRFHTAFLKQQQQRRQEQQMPPPFPLVSPYFNFHFPPPTIPPPPTPIQEGTFEEQQRYSKQRRLSFSYNYPNCYNVGRQPLELNGEQLRLQDLRLTQYFGVPQDLEQYNQQMMYHDGPLNKRKHRDNDHDSVESQYQYKYVLPFTTNNSGGNDVINHSDLSSVSSYETAREEQIMEDEAVVTNVEQEKENNLLSNNPVKYLKHREYLKELVKKYGRSPGEDYMGKPIKKYKIRLSHQSKQLFDDEGTYIKKNWWK